MDAHDIEAKARWQMIIEDELHYAPLDSETSGHQSQRGHDMGKLSDMIGALAIFAAPVAFLYIVHGFGG